MKHQDEHVAAAVTARLKNNPIAAKAKMAAISDLGDAFCTQDSILEGTVFIGTGTLDVAREIGQRLEIPFSAVVFMHESTPYAGIVVNLLEQQAVLDELEKLKREEDEE